MNANALSRQLLRASQQAFRQQHAPFRIKQSHFVAQRTLCSQASVSSCLRKQPTFSRVANQVRHESTEASHKSPTELSASVEHRSVSPNEDVAARKAQEPAYELTFTCRKCTERSSHRITKQAYHFGTTLITCPGCKNRHLISDHLKIFSDKGITIEDILKEKGQFLKKGRLGEDGDIEFYDESNNEIGQTQSRTKD